MKHLLLFGLLIGALNLAQAQNDATYEAFSNSYSQEKAGNYKGAIQSISAIYNAQNYECNLRLGYLKYLQGEYAEASGYYNKAIALMPFAIEPKLGIVMPLAALGKWDDVLNQYAAILKIDPRNSAVNYKIGYIYYTRKKYTEAYKHFERVVNLYPFDYDGLIMYAWTNYRLGKTKEARVLFRKVLLLSPADKSATEGLALIH